MHRNRLPVAVAVLALALGVLRIVSEAWPHPLPSASRHTAAFDPALFVLNALLVPALDADAVPLLWVDPVSASHCGPGTTVRVNGDPLVAGSRVPDAPFELAWHADGCRPFGADGPRFDGAVRLIVFREDWGFSAIVEPAGLRVSGNGASAPLRRGSASLPQRGDAAEEFFELN